MKPDIDFIHRHFARFRENLDPETGAYFDGILRAEEQARRGARQNRQRQRGDLLRAVASSPWRKPEWSNRRTANEIADLGNRLRADQYYRAEPQATLQRIRELNGGMMPSAETIRKEIS
ncbi:hypothetical protein O9X81_10600 [Agrobacterium salinitolerans]|uniref:hypothetical protein n=1 Tax=Agrobacterium salinitolerans TaxID=1183413 RepID=UPI0022B82B7E|nr:hypothetical protein [Agrobacterium salinitolerans]MCZ7857067.1 hypothetical protein [Agrobacterium salinitolerans]